MAEPVRDDQADATCQQNIAARYHRITSLTRESSAIVRLQQELSAANERLLLGRSRPDGDYDLTMALRSSVGYHSK
jgi:hypothetical protein